jgi:hypothetical protein
VRRSWITQEFVGLPFDYLGVKYPAPQTLFAPTMVNHILEHNLESSSVEQPPMGANGEDPRRLNFIGLDANGQERVLFLTFAVICWSCFCKAVQFGFFRAHYNEAKVGRSVVCELWLSREEFPPLFPLGIILGVSFGLMG